MAKEILIIVDSLDLITKFDLAIDEEFPLEKTPII
jgi:hypothetical protein